ncbi:MAG: hypothetical protein M1826_000724 [Phylliscum demangeonii]|nr:MAG: hypothetical protein M1826_000724 [Phylliscum demangeonii]
MINQDGLDWEAGVFCHEPRWAREPSTEVIESLARKHLSIRAADRCDVVFHAEGDFHKLFRVIPGAGSGLEYIMRVALPLDPHRKTSSEVATMEYVRASTKIPIPNVVAYDSSNRNPLGFEWILMEFVHGTPLADRWRHLSMPTKEHLMRQLASYQAQLFAKPHREIGSIYRAPSWPTPPPSPSPSPYALGRLVHYDFFWRDRIHQTGPRGPFQNSHDWLSARLALLRLDQLRVLDSADSDDEELTKASVWLSVSQKLRKLLPRVFPPDSDQPEATFLSHDLGMENILVDEDGKLTAVLDWERVSMLPAWRACKLPGLLRDWERHERPERAEYLQEDGIVDELYWEHLLEFESTQLRKTFLDEMRRLCPEWVQVMERSEMQRDFDTAVSVLNPFDTLVYDWAATVEDGTQRCSLGSRFPWT